MEPTQIKLGDIYNAINDIEIKQDAAKAVLDLLNAKDFSTDTKLAQVKAELATIKAELATIKANQLSGDQKVQLSGNMVANEIYTLTPTTSQQFIELPHTNQGIFEQSITIDNSLKNAQNENISLTIQLAYRYSMPNDRNSWFAWSNAAVEGGARYCLVPERGIHIQEWGVNKVFEVIELRQPLWKFVLYFTAHETPASGNLILVSTRRY